MPNQKVLLLTPKQGVGMQLVAETTTDANGHFAFTQSGIAPGTFYLVQANLQEIAYHAAVPPMQFDSSGTASVNVTVYDSTHDASALEVRELRVLVGAQGSKIRVQEEYQVDNSSHPARTYSNVNGTFVFYVSPQAGEPTVSVTGLANMALPQATVRGKSPGEYQIAYALKPGITPVTVSYDADYSSGQFALGDHAALPIAQASMFVFPSNLQVESQIFKPTGVDAKNNIEKFEAENIARGTSLEARVSGEASASPPTADNAPAGEVKAVPNTMTRLGIPVFICFLLILLWALGVRASKEWTRWKERHATSPGRKQLEAKADALFNSLADLDELFAEGKIEKKKYWKERLDLKAKLMAVLKKGPPIRNESYATRRNPR
ncbi:MAG TPA: hypothetical protein VG028_03750 [Terriglobia bacterium]|nr:hypothetical protein [Terriglobia bacterium]